MGRVAAKTKVAEAARCYKADGQIIKLITVQEILDEQFVQKM